MADYKYVLKTSSGSFTLPVSPESFEMGINNNNTTVNINSLGDINLLGKRGLYSISLSSFFPNQYYYFCVTKPRAPYYYIEVLQTALDNNDICQLIITGTNVNLACTIEDLKYGERDGSGDVYFTISLKEYREVEHKKVNSSVLSSNRARTTTKTTSERTYCVKKGDTLSGIAKSQTGSSSNWRTIYNDNKSVIGGNPNLIYPGQVYKLRASY